MGQSFPTISATDSVASQLANLVTRTASLKSQFSGASAPTLEDGQVYYDTTLKAWFGQRDGVSEEIGSRLLTNLNMKGDGTNIKEIVDFRIHNTSSTPTAGAGTVGQTICHTGSNKLKAVVSSSVVETLVSASVVDAVRVPPLDEWKVDPTNPPSAASKGTAPTVVGWNLDSTSKKVNRTMLVPASLGSADLVLRAYFLLDGAEAAGDVLNLTLTLVSLAALNNEAPGGTAQSISGSYTIPGGGLSAGALVYVDFTLDFDHGTVPINAGDILCLQMSRTDITNVAGVILLGSVLRAPFGLKLTE